MCQIVYLGIFYRLRIHHLHVAKNAINLAKMWGWLQSRGRELCHVHSGTGVLNWMWGLKSTEGLLMFWLSSAMA